MLREAERCVQDTGRQDTAWQDAAIGNVAHR
jgi:hypothetical protein